MYRITFEGNGKQEVLYPAGDNCDTVLNENGKYYVMGDENKNLLATLLGEYDIYMPDAAIYQEPSVAD